MINVFVAQITDSSFNSDTKIFDYNFVEIVFNKTNGTVTAGQLSGGENLKAIALNEIGQDMTEKDPTIADGTYAVLLYIGNQMYILNTVSGLVDVWYSVEDDKFYKKLASGKEEEWALSTLYPEDGE